MSKSNCTYKFHTAAGPVTIQGMANMKAWLAVNGVEAIIRPRRLASTPSIKTFDWFDRLGRAQGNARQGLQDARSMLNMPFDGQLVEDADLSDYTPAAVDTATGNIHFNPRFKMSRAQWAQAMAEELMHTVDLVGEMTTMSATSRRLDLDSGDIGQEVRRVFEGGRGLADFLAYPLDARAGLGQDRQKAELFARLAVLYFGDPSRMQRELPTAYEAYHDLFGTTVFGAESRVLRDVRSDSAGRGAQGGRERAGPGADGGAVSGGGVRGGDSGLDALRAAVARVFGASTDGRLIEDDQLETRADNRFRTVREAVAGFDVKGATGDRLAHYRGMALQTLGRRQLVDLYGDLLPELRSYDGMVQQMDADKNESSAEADKLVRDWAALDERSAKGFGAAKHPGMERKLAELMHDATLARIDPAKTLPENASAALKMQHKALKDRFDALTPKAQEVYRQARDMYADHFRKVRQAIMERVERSDMDPSSKQQMLKRLDTEMFKKLEGVYFPLARFGSYVVVSKDAAGKVMSVSRAETLAEANAMRREVVSRAEPGVTVSRVFKDAEYSATRDAVGKGFVADLMGVLQKQGAGEEVMDAVSQLYLASLPDLSWAKHGLHRKGTPGFSQDARRAYAQHMFHGSRYLAKLRYADQLADQLVSMGEQIKERREDADFDPVKAQQVLDELNKRHDLLMNPNSHPASSFLTSLGFIWYLGISPASAVVNLSQTALVAYPVMGAKWGFAKAGAALMKASSEVLRAKNDLSGVLKGDELEAFKRAVDDGTIDVTQAHDLAGVAQGEDDRVAWAMRPAMRAASFFFHHAERFNRQATFMAAYRLARETGVSKDVAFEQAKKATYDGHFDYAASNRPRVMQGNWQKVLFLFKQYGQNMVYTLSRQAYLSMKGMTPEQRTEARKQLGGILALHAAAAGALGLPVVGVLLSAASFLGGDDDEPWDAEVALKNMMADALGPKAAEVIAHGLSRLTPWDISGRVALNKLILPDVQEGLEGTPLWEKMVTAAIGPVPGIAGGFFKGMAEVGQGEYHRGFESMLPVVLKGPLKAIRQHRDGEVDKAGNVIKEEVSLAGMAGQFAGFRASEVALAREGRSAIYQAKKALEGRRSDLVRVFAKARMEGDEEGVADVMADIRRFNEKNPSYRITVPNLMQSVRQRQKRIDQGVMGVYIPKARRDEMADLGRFAMVE